MRTLEEIQAYYPEAKERDPIGMALGDLLVYLPEAGEAQQPIPTDDEIVGQIVGYLPFAFDKAEDHRGLSANRSVQHLTNWAWLLGREDLVAFATDDDNYRNYGVPILKRFAQEFGVHLPSAIECWPNGRPCTSDCERGCGR